MEKFIPGIILIVFGAMILAGGLYSGFGIFGIGLIVIGIFKLIFPRQDHKFTNIKSRNNTIALIMLVIISIAAAIYIWWK